MKRTLLTTLTLTLLSSPNTISEPPILVQNEISTEVTTTLDISTPVENIEEIQQPQAITLDLRVSFYTDADNELEGGAVDRRGVPLASYTEPVVAMPPDVPYGSKLVIDGVTYKVVDTGGAMKWTGIDKCNIDIFIPGKTTEWLNRHTGVFKKMGELYINE